MCNFGFYVGTFSWILFGILPLFISVWELSQSASGNISSVKQIAEIQTEFA